ncbi:MAG: ABC transporter permease, partial [Thiolinea sp.]
MISKLQNFAGVMNFVIFPMFFASTALYPLWRIQENAPWLATVVEFNPFTHGVELIRFALYEKLEWVNLVVVLGCLAVFFGLALWGYQSRRHLLKRKFR